MPELKTFQYLALLYTLLYFTGCGGDAVPEDVAPKTGEINAEKTASNDEISKQKSLDHPLVRVEELDHTQEFFKEQHTTSFSYVPRKNWTSFTASKNGILTKVLLFGKANLLDSPHYGLSMSGFIRADTPDIGPKLGQWSLSRDEILTQLAAQGLGDKESGWLTIKMRGKIPQVVGTKYFLVCDSISENKAWFGEFSFAEANPYEFGRHWLNEKHDLVMRTYVGKTDQQIKLLQVGLPTKKISNVPQEVLPTPISQNPNQLYLSPPPVTPVEVKEAPLSPPFSENVPSTLKISEQISAESNQSGKKSLFDRLFKKDK